MVKNKGITLIALVITIIVLLILAAVSIATLTGDNGILTQANKAKIETRGASVEEARDLWEINQNGDSKLQNQTAQTLEELLNDLEKQKLITSEEKEKIEETGKITIGSRTIEFYSIPNPEVREYDCIEDVQTYEVTKTGIYKIECWGASGGDFDEEDSPDKYTGGNGAYTKGEIELKRGMILYLYVGGQGNNTSIGGYNGGGSLAGGLSIYGRSGGGATDIRVNITSDEEAWDNEEGLKKRIMVAAGGGGANNRNYINNQPGMYYMFGAGDGGAGGELEGIDGKSVKYKTEGDKPSYNEHAYGEGGTQISAGKSIVLDENNELLEEVIYGKFGKAGNETQSGGGSGYYPGGGCGHGGAGGGSSFISGHIGCNAIDKEGNHTNQPNHFSNMLFKNTQMIAGNKTMPSARTEDTTQGNDGDGYIKIAFLKDVD